ncbi:MAG: glycine zipper 2TM domain-containing protein [Arcobacteraceae bacterium]|jgi:uncharacterized protein YcfJ|nr:glycine zipper 2TM domain-containing protein [Arcobacteraceae bacterium]MDY0365520.1 glycine zipper 2TM domain-containing protein [Arcobacteraceae bacterium]
MKKLFKSVAILSAFILGSSSVVAAETVTIKVTEQTAISKPFTQKIKTGERCYEDTVEVLVDCGSADTNSIGIDTLVGATLGVVVGHQIGKGSGKDAAKIIGGLGGGYIANQQRANKKCKSYNQVTRCEPVYEYVTEDKVVGYRNCGEYNGQKICKESSTPLDTITISITQTITVH